MKYIIISIFFLHSIVITSFGAEGFFKDYFHDQGYHLSGQKHNDHIKTFLNYSIEPNFTTTSSFTKNRINGTAIDSNGVLLYPDNSPRFRIYYHSGGYFSHLDDCGGAIAHDRLRTFVANGGSWVGSCAGAGAASLAAYPGGTAMVGVYPHYYQDRGDRFLSDIKIMDMTHPIAIYYNNFLGYRDSIVDSTWFLSGGYFPDNVDPPYNFTTFLAKSVTPGYSISDKWAIVCYKDTNHINSGRVVLSGAHPEAGRSYTKKGKFFAAMCKFAAEGNGAPKIKGMLLNNLSRTMNDNTKSGYEKIGDKQYHHFTVFVPEEAETLEVTIAGETGYDFNLYLKKGGFAFTSNSLKSATGLGENKVIILTKSEGLSKGLWY
ncbi:MAG: hypothetical protein JNL74_02475, partial [Fibrobacteres bacterium]|nr:hypothetical protein [Fibrobacterota bacterium]